MQDLQIQNSPIMRTIEQSFTVQFRYGVYFTAGLFKADNTLLTEVLQQDKGSGPRKVFFVLDSGVAEAHPNLVQDIELYTAQHKEHVKLLAPPLTITGGEEVKNSTPLLMDLLSAVNEHGIDRHSYLIAIGGGAVLDMAGFAAAIAHRGIRHIRIPTTVLAQDDSAVGVKNSFNSFGKKNFLGTFAPPFAVINDSDFLLTLHDRDWRSGISEAIKVALIKDAAFYQAIKRDAAKLAKRDMAAMQKLIHRCAEMHVEHIGGADPFETGSSRPLDFGHWAAHKLEQLSDYQLRHGEAVAIGMALDVTYSMLKGMLTREEAEDVLQLLEELGFELYVPQLSQREAGSDQLSVIKGLQEFREHLGGKLTIMLLNKIGEGVEVHHMDEPLLRQAVELLQKRHQPQPAA
ncbi:3-dehydroquinate synthase [Pontibacter ummariensis]|uniref:3-dehydroquinate synthase n=1 Tax=Pontibacter ummariensis TaxID=1610492 RepID=A0A239IRM9_9BACT|nr:3-dehydroquinate synthase [Pontibacter ummariensis]PRY09692.1 3-dehydroquinate synthase [Pontibacter ummariensis]SNS95878.1 3-dehydroquinate synthase [Pontibacter ummariensis]